MDIEVLKSELADTENKLREAIAAADAIEKQREQTIASVNAYIGAVNVLKKLIEGCA